MKSNKRRIICFYAWIALPAAALAQTELANVFSELHSPDKAIRDSASNRGIEVLEREWPNIEQDSALICKSLSDPDPYIRLQASAILSVIGQYKSEHSRVVVSCWTGLIQAGSDSAARVRRNAIRALAFNAVPPPPEARLVFSSALSEASPEEKTLGSVGLIRLSSGSDTSAIQLVTDTLMLAKESASRKAILAGMTAARIKTICCSPLQAISFMIPRQRYRRPPSKQFPSLPRRRFKPSQRCRT